MDNVTTIKITIAVLLTLISFIFLTHIGKKYNKIGLKVLAFIPIINIIVAIFIAWGNFIINTTGEYYFEDED